MIYYCYKEINPLKVEISKLIFNEQKKEELEKYNKFSLKQIQRIKGKPKEKQKKSNLKKKGNNPPKKQKAKKITSFSTGEGIKKAEAEKIDVFGKSSRFDLKNKKTNLPVRPETSTKSERVNIKRNHSKKIKFVDNYDNRNSESDLNSSKDEGSKKDEDKRLDNFELNNLDYDEACEKDKRGFCKTYWSVLMREHVFLFTFFSGYDYNLFYIKIERFLTLICIEMTVNGLFFVHESMHRKYTEGEEFTFVQKIPQLLFTLISTHLIEIILCFFGMTDVHVYQIKALPKTESNGEKIIDIIDKMKNKLVCFFVFTFLLFLFNWYFISAFCAVYQNTQKIFLRDSAISFLTSMADPFIIYGATTLLRYLSLCACCKKKLGCLYKLSDLFPIF